MMRCIENAIAAGHIKRGDGEKLQKEIDDLLRFGLSTDSVKERITRDLEMSAKQAKRRALLQEARRRELTNVVLGHRNAKGEIDPAEGLVFLIENYGQAKGIDDLETRKWVIMRQIHTDLAQLLDEFHKGWLTGDLRRRDPDLVARMDNIVRELFGEDTKDVRARELSTAWSTVTEKLRRRYNAAGGAIGKLDKWGLPQSHSAESLLTIGEERWVDYLMGDGVLDRSRIKSPTTDKVLTDDELRTALKEIWKTITTDGWIDRDATEATFGKGSLAKRKDDHHRFLHFKNADAWLAYMRDFKAGDPFEGMMAHLAMMARDISTLEIMGPNPNGMFNYLKQLVLSHGAQAVPSKTLLAERRSRALAAIRKVLPGETGDDLVARITKSMEDLAEAQRKAAAADSEDMRAKARAAADRMYAIEAELDTLEPLKIGLRRGELERERTLITGEIGAVQGKDAPQLGGLSRRNKQRLDRLNARLAEINAEIDKMNASDTSIAKQEPAAYQDLIDAFAALKAETRMMRDAKFGSVDNPMTAAKASNYRAEKMWDVYRGNNYAPINSTFANTWQSARNLMTSVLLGSSNFTTLADIVNIRQARRMAGLDDGASGVATGLARIIGGYVDMLKYDRVAAMEAGLLLDASIHVMHQQARYLESSGLIPTTGMPVPELKGNLAQKALQAITPGKRTVMWTGWLADRTISLSGMAWMTQAAKWSFGQAIQLELAKLSKVKFDDLPKLMRDMFERHGIDEAHWDAIRSAAQHEPRPDVRTTRKGDPRIDAITKRRDNLLKELQDIKEANAKGEIPDWFQRKEDDLKLAIVTTIQRNDPNDVMMPQDIGDLYLEIANDPRGLRAGAWGYLKGEAEFERKRMVDHFNERIASHEAGLASEPAGGHTLRLIRPNEVSKVKGIGPLAAEKYLAMIHRETRYAIVEGTVKTRSYAGNERRGTFWGEMQLNMAQFKSFGVAHAILQWGRIKREFQKGNVGTGAKLVAGQAIGAALIGSLVNELIEIINGRDPVISTTLAKGKLPDWKYWGDGILKAGGLGILGDYLFAPINRGTGTGVGSQVLGPVGGLLDKMRGSTLGEMQNWYEGKNKEGAGARRAIDIARGVMPGSTLWFLRLAKERWGLNQMQALFDPNHEDVWKRHKQMIEKAKGNGYWWDPGRALPDRWPMIWPDASKLGSPRPVVPRKVELADRRARADEQRQQAAIANFPFKVGEKIEPSWRRQLTVVDGDTVAIAGYRWRLVGYDAPEVYSRSRTAGERSAGMQAALKLQDLIKSGKVQLEVTDMPDKWGRGRARLTVDGRDVADAMKAGGHVQKRQWPR